MEYPIFKLPIEEILNKIEIVYFHDKFRNSISISFNNITFSESKYLPMYYDENYNFLGIDFRIIESTISMSIAFSDKSIRINKNDELYFYFENNESITFKFLTGGIKGLHFNINALIPSVKELEFFAFSNLIYWRLNIKKLDLIIEGDNTKFNPINRMSSKNDSQEVLKYMAKIIVNELIKINKNRLKF